MKCAHCTVEFHDVPKAIYVGHDADGEWGLVKRTCPACGRFVLNLQNGPQALFSANPGKTFVGIQVPLASDRLVRPKG